MNSLIVMSGLTSVDKTTQSSSLLLHIKMQDRSHYEANRGTCLKSFFGNFFF